MRPILIELAPEDHAPKRSRSNGSNRPRVARPSSFATALPRECDERVSAIAAAVRAEPDDWHELFLALSGALLDRGIPPAMLPAFVESVSVATCSDTKTDDRRRGAETTVERASLGAAFASWGTLMRRWPRVADVVAMAFAPVVEPSAGVELPPARDGVQAMEAECGMGKTRRVADISEYKSIVSFKTRKLNIVGHAEDAIGRAPPGSKSSISVDKNELAIQIFRNIQSSKVVLRDAAGVASVKRVFGPLSVKDGCKLSESATPFVNGGQSLRKDFCEGRHKIKCPHYEGCTARLGIEGPTNARITVGPHALIAQLDEAAGPNGTLYIDEPPAPIDSIELSAGELDVATKYLASFETAYANAMRPIVAAVSEAGTLGAAPDMSALRNGCPEDAVPPVRWGIVVQARAHPGTARNVGAASRVYKILQRAIIGEWGLIEPTHSGAVMVSAINQTLTAALRREGQVIAMSADIGLYTPIYEKLLGYAPPMTRFAATDGAPIARTWVRVRASRTKWQSGEEGRAAFLRAIRRVLEWGGGDTIGIITFASLKAVLRAEVDRLGYAGEVRIAHFGGVRGLDSWKDLDGLATLGDPRPNLIAVQHEARYAGIPWEPRVEQLAQAELEQAMGRLRVVHRTRPGKQLHIGEVRPGGSGWRRDDVAIVDDWGGHPLGGELAMSSSAVEDMVDMRGVARTAAHYGVSVTALYRFRQKHR